MHSIKRIAVIVAALAATTSLVCADGQQASGAFRSKGIVGLRQALKIPVLPTSVGLSAQQSPGDPRHPRKFTQIDVPGASYTAAEGINRRGEIVGLDFDSSGNFHGFLLRNGQFITLDVPGAIGTDANEIDPCNDIVGDFTDSSGNTHGYLLRK